ncbi:hypothetical protein [Pelomonas sp. Root1444]|uniref:hypothetical protein n=1 Tax=Pelomonas sp. Root1444 TaxID=1736464 RepID=UPI0012F7B2F4|nr:hypothetical protein [Pelomonas sp. Root1444]
MSTYTIIWEYQGGTYMKQVRARTALVALLAWSRRLSAGEIPGIGEKRLARLVQAMEEDPAGLFSPVALTGLKSAWCASTPYGGLVNIVKTDVSR